MYAYHRVFKSGSVFLAWWWVLWAIDTPARAVFALTGHGLRFEHSELNLVPFLVDLLVYVAALSLAWFAVIISVVLGIARCPHHRR
jgi:hypothetical protein